MDGQLSHQGDSRQQYIPVSRAKVKDAVFQLEGIGSETRDGLLKVSQMLEAIWHHSTHQGLENLKRLYELMDPDQDGIPDTTGSDEFLAKLDGNLVDGNWEKVSDEEMQQALEGTGTLATVAETDSGEIAGFVAAERTSPRKGHIVTIDVRRQCRGEGLGTQLMLRVEDQLLRLGASTIELETGRENSAAQSLFKNLGYERLAIIDDYYPDGGGAWIMRKRIARPPANRPCVAG